jgi:dienelactone hydrolase
MAASEQVKRAIGWAGIGLVLTVALWQLTRPKPLPPAAAQPRVQALRYNVGRLQGIVRLPLAPTPAPLALLVHGTHGVCRQGDGRDVCPQHGVCPPGSTRVPSPEGLLYLAEALAQHGVAAVSVDAQEFGCDDSAVAVRERADLLEAHVALWRQFSQGQGVLGADVRGRVNIDRLIFVGHSTGGEAAALMPAELGLAVAAVVAIAPTDATLADPGRVPLAVFVGGCDIDDHKWAGRALFSRSLAHPEAPHALWFLGGADHAGSLTTWPADSVHAGFSTCDQPVAAADHRALLAAAVAGWVEAVLVNSALPAWLTGDAPPPATLGWRGAQPPDWRVAYAGRGRRPSLSDPQASGGAFLQACAGIGCSNEWGASEPGLRVDWRQAGASVAW